MNPSTDYTRNEKAVRMVEYLLRLASLRSTLVRDIVEYAKVLWVNDIPRQKGCFTQAWGPDEGYDSDIWVEVQNRREPELPSIPDLCNDWIDKSALRNKHDLPALLPEITRQAKNPALRKGSDQPELTWRTEHLEDHPNVQPIWDQYIKERWLPWREEHNVWENIHKVYGALFAIHQEQLRLGEEYELVLGLGRIHMADFHQRRAATARLTVGQQAKFDSGLPQNGDGGPGLTGQAVACRASRQIKCGSLAGDSGDSVRPSIALGNRLPAGVMQADDVVGEQFDRRGRQPQRNQFAAQLLYQLGGPQTDRAQLLAIAARRAGKKTFCQLGSGQLSPSTRARAAAR